MIGLLAFAGTARAQSPAAAPTSIPIGDWQISPTLEVRSRGEYRRDSPELAGGSASSPSVQDAFGILERTRLGVGADYGGVRGDPGLLRAQLTLQDARAWGSAPTGVLGSAESSPASTGHYEGWIEARTSAARPAYLRFGRQEVTWGDGRLLASADWSPTGRTLDAARGHASAGMFDFELLAALLDPPSPLGVAFGQTAGPMSTGTELYGGQIAASPAPLLKLELSLLARVRRHPQKEVGDGDTYVGSLRVFGGPGGGWRYAVEGAYEVTRSLLDGEARSAYAGAGYLEKTLDSLTLSPSLRLEADYASGGTPDGSRTPFDPILPDVHTLHGAMDLFAWSNTVQASARIGVVPWQWGEAAIEYRYVRLAETGAWLDAYLNRVGTGGYGAELGHEVDAWVSWRPWPVLELGGGYSAFVLSGDAQYFLSTTAAAGGGARGEYTASIAHFAYAQATLRVP